MKPEIEQDENGTRSCLKMSISSGLKICKLSYSFFLMHL